MAQNGGSKKVGSLEGSALEYLGAGILPMLLLSNIRNRYQPASKLVSSLLHRGNRRGILLGVLGIDLP